MLCSEACSSIASDNGNSHNNGSTYSILKKKVELWRDRTRVIMRNGTVDVLNANVTVELLTGETIFICSFEGKTTCSTIWNRVEGELLSRGVVHPHIFGLAIKIGSDWIFVDPEAKVSKYFPKEWRCSSNNENKTLVLHCRIHFYLESLPPNFDVVSLLHYYIQLRQNLGSNPKLIPVNLVQAVAFALQGELGDWKNQHHNNNQGQGTTDSSSSSSSLASSSSSAASVEFPRWVSSLKLDHAALMRAYQALCGLGQNAARIAFIKAMSPQYNMHLYGMTLVRSKDGKDAPAWIGVTPKGIEIYQLQQQQNSQSHHNEIPSLKVTFLWANITKLSFERKKFEIRGRNLKCSCGGSTEKLTFTGTSELVPRHLLLLCRSTHQFSLSTAHSIKLEQFQAQHGLKSLSSSALNVNNHHHLPGAGQHSISNDSLLHLSNKSHLHHNNDEKMLDLSLWADGLLLGNGPGSESNDHQRVSVISNASSNTTSGIVSDRVYSLDGSEEELDMRETECCSEHGGTTTSASSSASATHHHRHSLLHHHHHHTNNSTSLESLSQKPAPPLVPRLHNHHHLSTTTTTSNNASSTTNTTNRVETTSSGVATAGEEDEPKYWYCDSDCEDCCEEAAAAATSSASITGSCRSLLVRTISEKGHCDCHSCAVEDELDGLDLSSETNSATMESANAIATMHHHYHHHHQNSTPSMASEATLKAFNFDSASVNTVTAPENSEFQGDESEKKTALEKHHVNGVEESNLEHVYGEIKEIEPKKTDERQEYGTIVDGDNVKVPVPKPRGAKTGTGSCIEHEKATSCREKNNNKKSHLQITQRNIKLNNGNISINNKCGKDVFKCKHKASGNVNGTANGSLNPSTTTISVSAPAKMVPNETECLTTKIASRKCLRTQRVPPPNSSSTPTANNIICSNTKKNSCNNAGSTGVSSSSRKVSACLPNSLDETDSCSSSVAVHNINSCNGNINTSNNINSNSANYNELMLLENEKLLRQGRYPCTRTVSDNFDTDSDYVQLPPLHPRPILHAPSPLTSHSHAKSNASPTSKLWKFVTSKKSALNKSCGNLNLIGSNSSESFHNGSSSKSKLPPPPPVPPHSAKKNGTIPRRYSQNIIEDIPPRGHGAVSISNKISASRSTTALNQIVNDEVRPEPPPRPKKLTPGVELKASMAMTAAASNINSEVKSTNHISSNSKAVDARIILTKPQILIQTAYATPAPIAKPSQAQILYRESQVNNGTSISSSPVTATTPVNGAARSKSQIVPPKPGSGLYHSQSVDNIYDTVAFEEPACLHGRESPPPPLYPKSNKVKVAAAAPKPKAVPMIIRSNNYIDVHASAAVRQKRSMPSASVVQSRSQVQTNARQQQQRPISVPNSRCGSVPNNLNLNHNFMVGLQNLKPLSRSPIVYPNSNQAGAAVQGNNNNGVGVGNSNSTSALVNTKSQLTPTSACLTNTRTTSNNNLSQLNQSQIQHFKAQLYSDMDYVIFPQKDPRLSQQDYIDSKGLSFTTTSCTNSNPLLNNMSISTPYSLNDIPPPYLPPPPPYPSPTSSSCISTPQQTTTAQGTASKRNSTTSSTGLASSNAATPHLPSYQDVLSAAAAAGASSYQSLYNAAMSSNASQCSSSQYGYYAVRPHQQQFTSQHPYGAPGTTSTRSSSNFNGLNAENLQRFLSTQSLIAGNSHYSMTNGGGASTTPTPIYYPASTHSAPPLPPYKDHSQLIIENGMRKAVHKLLQSSSLASSGLLDETNERIRLKLLCRSDDSLYTQPNNETEQKLQKMYNLPPPPPYKRNSLMSPSEMDLVKLRARCSAMELPMLKALCSETDLLTQQKQLLQNKLNGMIASSTSSSPSRHSNTTTPRTSASSASNGHHQPTRSNSNPSQPKSITKEPLADPINQQQVPPARPPKPAKLRQQMTN